MGPNGAILTALNLFATRIDQLVELLESREEQVDTFLVDTPGQVEVMNTCSVVGFWVDMSEIGVYMVFIRFHYCRKYCVVVSNSFIICSRYT